MARRIAPESNTVTNTTVSQEMPHAQIYLPNYRAVNQIFVEAPGKAEINFLEVLGRSSLKMLQTQERVYQGLERDNIIADVNTRYQESVIRFQEENPSGRGYTEYATGTYKRLIEEAAESANSPEVSQSIRAFGYANAKGIANSAVQEENKRFVAHTLAESQKLVEIKYNQIQNDPSRLEGLSAEATSIVNNLEGVIPASQLAAFRQRTSENLLMSYGVGLVRKSPQDAANYLKSDFFAKNLSSEAYNRLTQYADRKQIEEEKRQHRLSMEMLTQQNRNSGLEKENMLVAIERDAVELSDIEENSILTPLHKQQVTLHYERRNAERFKKDAADDRMSEIFSQGGDISEIEPKYQQQRYEDIVRSKQQALDGAMSVGEEQQHVTVFEKAMIASAFSCKMPKLKDEAILEMEYGEPQNAIRAAAAVKYLLNRNPVIIGDIPAKYVNFATDIADRAQVQGTDKTKLVDLARKTYLRERSSVEAKEQSKKQLEYLKRINLNSFISEFDFDRNWYRNVTVSDSSQFETDLKYEIRQAVAGGADNFGDAKAIAASNLRDYWRETDVNGFPELMRCPPEFTNPNLGEIAIKNSIAARTAHIVSKLGKGSEFSLVNKVIHPSKDTKAYYKEDLRWQNRAPVIGVKINGKTESRDVFIEPIAGKNGLFKLFVYVDKDKHIKKYLPNPDNPFLNAAVSFDGAK